MLYVVLTMPTLNKAYLFIYLLLSNVCKRQNSMLVCLVGGAPLIDSSWQTFADIIHRNASVKDKCIFTT
jgi:hypothetical protein